MYANTPVGLSLLVVGSVMLSSVPAAIGQEKYCTGVEIFDVAIFESPSSPGVSITGILFSNSSSPSFTQMKIVAELYDANNRLVGVESTYPEIEGDFSPFKVQTSVSNAILDHFILHC